MGRSSSKAISKSRLEHLAPPPAMRGQPSPSRPPTAYNYEHQGYYTTPPRPVARRRRWIAWFVPTIVMVNIGILVYEMYLNDCPQKSHNCIEPSTLGRFAFQSFKENPLLGPSPVTLLNMGALEVSKVVDKKEVWRLFSCMWLHAGVFHVLTNMLSLLFVGIRMEQEFGFVRIGFLYVISGIGGSLLSSLFVRKTISVGASGALFGLLGAMLSELITNWSIYERKCEAFVSLIVIILINLAVGILPHVDNFAHIGGFVSGFLLGFSLLIRPRFGYVSRRDAHSSFLTAGKKKPKYMVYQLLLLLCSLIILIVGFGFGFVLLLRGVDGNTHCSWCHYLSCVPIPLWNCNEQNEARCQASQIGNQLNLRCLDNKKSPSFQVLDQNINDTALLQKLCSQLCSM